MFFQMIAETTVAGDVYGYQLPLINSNSNNKLKLRSIQLMIINPTANFAADAQVLPRWIVSLQSDYPGDFRYPYEGQSFLFRELSPKGTVVMPDTTLTSWFENPVYENFKDININVNPWLVVGSIKVIGEIAVTLEYSITGMTELEATQFAVSQR